MGPPAQAAPQNDVITLESGGVGFFWLHLIPEKRETFDTFTFLPIFEYQLCPILQLNQIFGVSRHELLCLLHQIVLVQDEKIVGTTVLSEK